MACSDKIFVGDEGTILEVTVYDCNEGSEQPLNIGSASVKNIILKKPDGTEITIPAAFVTDGTDGKLQVIPSPGTIDVPGAWSIKAYLEMPNFKLYSTQDPLYIYTP